MSNRPEISCEQAYINTLIQTKELIKTFEKMEELSKVLTNPNLSFYKVVPEAGKNDKLVQPDESDESDEPVYNTKFEKKDPANSGASSHAGFCYLI